jgi:hypothetical protein
MQAPLRKRIALDMDEVMADTLTAWLQGSLAKSLTAFVEWIDAGHLPTAVLSHFAMTRMLPK